MKMTIALTILSVSILLSLTYAAADEPEQTETVKLEVGDKAPDFELPNAGEGEPQKLSDFEGEKSVLLAFYPKAFTPGCTKQLCGYRDEFSEFKSHDTEVIAISIDEQTRSDEFKKEYELPFTVLGDTNKDIIKAYGVPIRSRGTVEFAQRSVFLVDTKGTIQYVDLDYNIEKDKEPLFAAVEKVSGAETEK